MPKAAEHGSNLSCLRAASDRCRRTFPFPSAQEGPRRRLLKRAGHLLWKAKTVHLLSVVGHAHSKFQQKPLPMFTGGRALCRRGSEARQKGQACVIADVLKVVAPVSPARIASPPPSSGPLVLAWMVPSPSHGGKLQGYKPPRAACLRLMSKYAPPFHGFVRPSGSLARRSTSSTSWKNHGLLSFNLRMIVLLAYLTPSCSFQLLKR